MRYIVLDTSSKYLSIGLVDEDVIVGTYQELCIKSQSEQVMPVLVELMNQHHWLVDEIDAMVITKGPGSYTGVRIAMSVAKVFCSLKKKTLYTLSTLQAWAGMNEQTLVMLDARSQRAYVGVYHLGSELMADCILPIEEVRVLSKQYHCVGDCMLLGQDNVEVDLIENIVLLRDQWERVELIHTLTPLYLKEQDAYGK